MFVDRRDNALRRKREKLPWPQEQRFKILSLDGGGIRGVYGATLLLEMENELAPSGGISSFFDMIAGTSTGGIMALALGVGIPAHQIHDLYAKDGQDIFPQRQHWRYLPIAKSIRQLLKPVYDYKVLECLLRREFGDLILGDSNTRLVIPAFMSPKSEITVFKTDHHPDFLHDWKTEIWKVARATSAAPTYLGGHEQEDVIFLDGGIWANNPIMVAIVDALSCYDITTEQIDVLSIGTGNFPFELTLKSSKAGLIGWRQAITAAMYLTSDNASSQAGLLIGPENIARFEPDEDAASIALDDWAKSMEILPETANRHFRDRLIEIRGFFEAPVRERDRFNSVGR